MNADTIINASEMRGHLLQLYTERALAEAEGLGANQLFMADIDAEIAAVRSFYVGMAVTEIATLRGQLSGRNQG